MHAHDELLSACGSSWDDWRSLNTDWFGSVQALVFRDKLQSVLRSEYGDKRLFMVKDPRISRFLPFFVSVLDGMEVTPVALFVFRKPLEVAFSLRRRNGFSIAKGAAMWLRHVFDAESNSREMLRHFVCYDDLLKDWRSELEAAGKQIGVRWPADPKISSIAIQQFLAAGMHHEKSDLESFIESPELREFTDEAFHLLCTIAKAGPDPDLFLRWDNLRSKFDQASVFFEGLMSETTTEHPAVEVSQISTEARQRAALCNHLEEEKRDLFAEIERLKAEIEQLQKSPAENEGRHLRRVDELMAVLEQKKEDELRLLSEISDRDIQFKNLNERFTEQVQANRELLNRLTEIYASRSWNVTKPLRAVSRLFFNLIRI
jgi:hypothetical protein